MHFHYFLNLYQISVAFNAQKTCRVYNEKELINMIKDTATSKHVLSIQRKNRPYFSV